MIGGLDEQPKLTTGYRKVAMVKPGTDAKDFLPSAMCKGGLCSGAMPGCTKVTGKKLHFPKIIFNFNRPYYYSMRKKKGKFGGLMKRVVAYAFSTLPEIVDVMMNELNQTSKDGNVPSLGSPAS